jgi:hypothetical protein
VSLLLLLLLLLLLGHAATSRYYTAVCSTVNCFYLLGSLFFSSSHSSDHWAMFSLVCAWLRAVRSVLFQHPATEADPQRLFSPYRSKVKFKSELNRSTNLSLSLSLSLSPYSGLISFSLLLANIFFFKRRFHFNTAASAYLDMVAEYKHSQSFFGPMISLLAVGYAYTMACIFIVALYYRTVHRLNVGYAGNGEYNVFSALIVIEYGPSVALVLYAATAVNDRTTQLNEMCTDLMARSSVNTGAGGVDGSERSSARIRQPDFFFAAAVQNSEAATIESGSKAENMATNLAFLVDRSPCQVLLCGQRFTRKGLSLICAYLLLTQIVNLLGFGG